MLTDLVPHPFGLSRLKLNEVLASAGLYVANVDQPNSLTSGNAPDPNQDKGSHLSSLFGVLRRFSTSRGLAAACGILPMSIELLPGLDRPPESRQVRRARHLGDMSPASCARVGAHPAAWSSTWWSRQFANAVAVTPGSVDEPSRLRYRDGGVPCRRH